MPTSSSHVAEARHRALRDKVLDPTRIDGAFAELRKNATMLVPGSGNLEAAVAVVGEAPGEVEDRTGCPFVGPAGQLLDEFLSLAGLHRDECWITNVIKYMPLGPDGRIRAPKFGEHRVGRFYLRRELAIIGPRLVILCGSNAYRAVRSGRSISREHGQAFRFKGTRIYYPVLHPSACLRVPEKWMEPTGADFCRIPALLAGRAEDVPVVDPDRKR